MKTRCVLAIATLAYGGWAQDAAPGEATRLRVREAQLRNASAAAAHARAFAEWLRSDTGRQYLAAERQMRDAAAELTTLIGELNRLAPAGKVLNLRPLETGGFGVHRADAPDLAWVDRPK